MAGAQPVPPPHGAGASSRLAQLGFPLFYGYAVIAAVMCLDVCTAPGHSTGELPTVGHTHPIHSHCSLHHRAML